MSFLNNMINRKAKEVKYLEARIRISILMKFKIKNNKIGILCSRFFKF